MPAQALATARRGPHQVVLLMHQHALRPADTHGLTLLTTCHPGEPSRHHGHHVHHLPPDPSAAQIVRAVRTLLARTALSHTGQGSP